VVAEGPEDRCRELLGRLEGRGTPGRVSQVSYRFAAAVGGIPGFTER